MYSEGAANLNDMKDMLASLPQYQEQREKVRYYRRKYSGLFILSGSSRYISVWHKIVWNYLKRRSFLMWHPSNRYGSHPFTRLSCNKIRLKCCATGLTAEGKTPKGLVEEMVPLLDSRDVL